ncbi:MAG TPA: carboxypeptidase regulatory-like domain-containing protein [Polyangiaceae bacterium]|nr:carboxypeptidase regulatory-like domain-containing protein [Polyangiaceae bacterium]
MSTRDSGPNLLDEFFSPPKDDADEEVEVVDDVEEGDEADAAAIASAAPRRSLPPPPPSMRAPRGASVPPQRGSTQRVSSPPPPLRSTLVGMPDPVIEDGEDGAEMSPSADANEEAVPPTMEAAGLEAGKPAQFEQETYSSGFAGAGMPEHVGEPPVPEENATTSSDDDIDRMLGALETPDTQRGEERPSGESDMASALVGSLDLRGDTPSATDTTATGHDVNEVAASSDVFEQPAMAHDDEPMHAAAQDNEPVHDAAQDNDEAQHAVLPVPPVVGGSSGGALGPSSAWPAAAKIDEWDDDWAPSLAALGAQDAPAVSLRPPSRSKVPADGSPFRLSLPAPPPPPMKRAMKLPMPHTEDADEPEVASPVTDESESVEHASYETAASADGEGEPSHPSLSMEMSPFGSADEVSREDLTRPLPPTELARLAATGEASHPESEILRDDVTIPLPGLSSDELGYDSPHLAALPDPYTSDTDLTRPLIQFDGRGDVPRSLILPPLRPPPEQETSDVPVIVAVPPPTVGTVEHSPSIQITSGSEYTPTSQLSRPFSPTRTSPGMRGVLPPIPKPAPVPTDFGKRGPSHSVVPVAGSVFPPGFASNRRWLIGLAAALFGMLAVGFAMRSRSGSLVVTVAGPTGAAVSGVAVRVDGMERCTSAPCIVKDLKPGMHLVSASGSGLEPSADRAIVLEPGEQVAHHVVLSGEERATAGLSVAAIGGGLHVTVDGRDVGAPPVTLNDVAPGEHTVRIVGDERFYQPYQEVVKLDRGEVRSLGPVRLRVLRGQLELRAGEGADGATIAVDGRRVQRLPASIELSADESHEVTASKPGHPEFTQEVVFDGTAERAVTVSFGPDAASAVASEPVHHAASATSTRSAMASAAPTRSRAVSSSTTAPAVAAAAPAGTATLDITSTPPSAVVVNGRPLGTTPLHNVHVGAGKQTVLFVHPSLGRKVASANVAPGGRASIGVKF